MEALPSVLKAICDWMWLNSICCSAEIVSPVLGLVVAVFMFVLLSSLLFLSLLLFLLVVVIVAVVVVANIGLIVVFLLVPGPGLNG